MLRLVLILSAVILQFQGCGKNEYGFSSSESFEKGMPDIELPADDDLETPRSTADCDDLPPRKVCVCHVPSGRPEAMHTIVIDRRALQSHLHEHHGGESSDSLGPCPE